MIFVKAVRAKRGTLNRVSPGSRAQTVNISDRDGKAYLMSTETPKKPTGLPGAEVARALDLVSYQEGAVVSREVIRKPTGNVTLFAFDEGQGLSEHTAPFDALVQVLEGEAEITIAGRPYRVAGGELVLMPAGQPHALKALRRFKMMLTMLRSSGAPTAG